MGKYAVACTMEHLIQVAARQDKKNLPQYCGVNNCARPHRTMNLCLAHYMRLWKYRQKHPVDFGNYPFPDLNAIVKDAKGRDDRRGLRLSERRCHVADCKNRHVGRGLCRKHYQVWWKANRG